MDIDGNSRVEKLLEVEPAVAGEAPIDVEGNGKTGKPSEEPKKADNVPMEVDENSKNEKPMKVSKGADNKGTENNLKDLGSFGASHKDKHDANSNDQPEQESSGHSPSILLPV
ncbi:hypothetical protein GALMADRAFT_134784 [Galerina marginata CBS 339.88]|uniref:Uncharacterized protein n=1 Tax=Galerina marginata (strain CBS 339.88) TaxID=685588 RepID=A0A067TG53_GALM3|nr:hypothetical protein GALMADRAFT_134784 [Galerina marginata CBS 339.88]